MHKLPQNPRTDSATPGDPDALPAPETFTVTTRRVKCDGGGGPLGHPVVYYDMGEENFVECLYCDRRFVLDPSAGDEH
ncbi:MAG TPA: zinc-finger domain-containing protein [Caulobacterales bacterium]|nr:zinc-finger domain-containing protein [Caulobacterales bacterium]